MLPGSGVRDLGAHEFAAPVVSDAHGDARLGEALASLVHEGLHLQGRINLRLRGDSMWPTIPAGSLVAVEEVTPGDIRLGDVVIWQQGGQLIAHRVVHKVRDGSNMWLVTKGDNCSAADPWLEPSAVLGRLVAVYNQDGAAKLWGSPAKDLEGAFWVSRWRFRQLAGAAGRFVPMGFRPSLTRCWDRLGYCLSLALKLMLLRY